MSSVLITPGILPEFQREFSLNPTALWMETQHKFSQNSNEKYLQVAVEIVSKFQQEFSPCSYSLQISAKSFLKISKKKTLFNFQSGFFPDSRQKLFFQVCLLRISAVDCCELWPFKILTITFSKLWNKFPSNSGRIRLDLLEFLILIGFRQHFFQNCSQSHVLITS